MSRLFTPLVFFFALAGVARADTVYLEDGRVLDGVRVEAHGDALTICAKHGSIDVERHEVVRIVPGPTREEREAALRDDLARRKLEAGHDPVALRALSDWCRTQKLDREADQLVALARGIELESRLRALEPLRDARLYCQLARCMEGDYPESERRVVWEKALALDPGNDEARRALGFEWDGTRWLSPAEVARREAARRAREQAEAERFAAIRRAADEARRASAELERLEAQRRAAEQQLAALQERAREAEARAAAAERAAQRAACERAAAERAVILGTVPRINRPIVVGPRWRRGTVRVNGSTITFVDP